MFTKLHSKKGQGMVEYGLIIALIVVVCIVAMQTLGTAAKKTLDKAATDMTLPAAQ